MSVVWTVSALRRMYCGNVGINLAADDTAHHQLLSLLLSSINPLSSWLCYATALSAVCPRYSQSSQSGIVLIYINCCKVSVYYRWVYRISIFISKNIFHLLALLLWQGRFSFTFIKVKVSRHRYIFIILYFKIQNFVLTCHNRCHNWIRMSRCKNQEC